MPTSSNDQKNNIKTNYSWKLAGGEVNDPLETQNACSHGAGSSAAVTSHPNIPDRKVEEQRKQPISGREYGELRPRRPPTRRRSGSVPQSGGSGIGTRPSPGR